MPRGELQVHVAKDNGILRDEGKIKMASEKVPRKMVLEIKYVNANNAVIHTENSKLLLDLNCSPKELEKNICKQLWN